jgi:serralysin
LDHIKTLINVDFVEVSGQGDPDINVGKVDFLRRLAGLGGFNYSTSGGKLNEIDSFTLFTNDINLANATSPILHEVGHALTLKHPFDGSATLPNDLDSKKYTVMSYDINPDNNQDSDAMMLFDVLALQDRWGANTLSYTGNTT